MEKKLEAELMSLAHRILQLRGRDNIKGLREQARELYEKLTVLSFVDEHFSTPQPTIGRSEAMNVLESGFANPSSPKRESSPETDVSTPAQAGNREAVPEKNKTPEEARQHDNWEEGWTPALEDFPKGKVQNEKKSSMEDEELPAKEEPSVKKEPEHMTYAGPTEKKEEIKTREEDAENEKEFEIPEDNLDDISVHLDDLPEFEPVFSDGDRASRSEVGSNEKDTENQPETRNKKPASKERDQPVLHLFSEVENPKTRNDITEHRRNLNEKFQHGLKFGLNDRLAFTQHLFDGNAADFNRIVSQLNTIGNYSEAKKFIEEQVKPDYDWSDQEGYEKRFLKALEHKMN